MISERIQNVDTRGNPRRGLIDAFARGARRLFVRPKQWEVRYVGGKLEVYYQGDPRKSWQWRSFMQAAMRRIYMLGYDPMPIANAAGHASGWYQVYDYGTTTQATTGTIYARIAPSDDYEGADFLGIWGATSGGYWKAQVVVEAGSVWDVNTPYEIPNDGRRIAIAIADSTTYSVEQLHTGPIISPLPGTDSMTSYRSYTESTSPTLRCCSISSLGNDLTLFNFAPNGSSVGTSGGLNKSEISMYGLPSGTHGIHILVRVNRSDGGQRVYLTYETIDDLLEKSSTIESIESRLDALEGA